MGCYSLTRGIEATSADPEGSRFSSASIHVTIPKFRFPFLPEQIPGSDLGDLPLGDLPLVSGL